MTLDRFVPAKDSASVRKRFAAQRQRIFFVLTAAAFVALTFSPQASRAGAAENPALRDWAIGQILEEDIVTPIPLDIFNAGETESLRLTEAQKVPPTFQFDSAKAAASEMELQRHFTSGREQFVQLLESSFQQRPLRSIDDLGDTRFREVIAEFHSKNPAFPLSTNLAQLWALGDDGHVVLQDLTTQLRKFTGVYVRADRLPDGERLINPSVRIVVSDHSSPNGVNPSPASILTNSATSTTNTRAFNVPRANLMSLARYRRDLVSLAEPRDKSVIAFLAGFVQINSVFDEDATRLARERRVQDINVMDHYAAGEVVVRRGQAVDARVKPALDALRAHWRSVRNNADANRLQADLERARNESAALRTAVQSAEVKAAEVSAARREMEAIQRRNRRWLTALGAVCFAGLLLAGLWWRARRQRFSRPNGWAVGSLGDGSGQVEVWRERALAAEARAQKATAILKMNLLPHMARWMMSELWQRLLSQKSVAQTTAQRAELEVAELAGRLEKLHAPIEERRRAYERRIAELEAELAARDRQDRELIQARIDSTRRRMAAEQSEQSAWQRYSG